MFPLYAIIICGLVGTSIVLGIILFCSKRLKSKRIANQNTLSIPSLLRMCENTPRNDLSLTVHHTQDSLQTLNTNQAKKVDDHGHVVDITLPVVLHMFDVVTEDNLGGRVDHHEKQRSQKEVHVGVSAIERFLVDMGNEKPVRFTSSELQDFTWNYKVKLGAGGFGVVYKGVFPSGVEVAVKVLNDSTTSERIKEQFMAEVSTIGRTYHKNLVRLYGFCFESATKALVYEYMKNGSLDRILFDKKLQNSSIKWEKLYDIAIGTAKGLAYLHEDCQKRIIHYDIKPGNILLDSKFNPKVADFGLAKLCNWDSSHVTMTGGRGTPGYAAPELWMPFPITYKCDVYSYGMMLFEIVGRRRNLDLSLPESRQWFPRQVWEKFEMEELDEMINGFDGIEKTDREKVRTMILVAFWCVQYLPDARPSMSSVVKILQGGSEVKVPPNPFLHLGFSSAALALRADANREETGVTANITSAEAITGIMSTPTGYKKNTAIVRERATS
ncbi:rust resistance kinase Lr10-like [Papaver somniferum]|nr:rust resistance kinase Lr10-like [Papaver somniferum]